MYKLCFLQIVMNIIIRRQTKDIGFISEFFGNTMRIKGTILKVDVENGFENYTHTVGNPMTEDTLIIGDEDNNVILCFKENNELYNKHVIVEGVHVALYFDYKKECIVHKKTELADMPDRIINIIFQTNFVQSIINNFNQLQIANHMGITNYKLNFLKYIYYSVTKFRIQANFLQ